MKNRYYISVKRQVRYFMGLLLVLALAVVVLCSCIREEIDVPVPSVGTQVTLSVQVPGSAQYNDAAKGSADDSKSAANTRAMPADEARIDDVSVLLFYPGGALVGAYQGSAPQNHPSIPGRRTFTVTLPEGNFDVMVIANSQTYISSAGLTAGMSRAQVSAALWMRQTGKWNVAGNDLFPFWGELKNVVLQKGGTLGVIPLNRAVAKIDIVSSDAIKNDFTLQTVSVYHWQENMALIPDEGTMQGNEVIKATRTGANLNLYPSSGKITYSGSDIANGGISSKIYVNETPNPGSANFPVMPCIVVGGQLRGETGLRYYRIDLSTVAPDGTRTYRDLLRNHHYNVTLKEVLTNGSDTEEEAYRSITVEIETDIQVWEEGDMKNVIIDGEYWLRVDPAEFELAREAHAATPGARAESFTPDDYFFEIESNTSWSIDPATIEYSPSGQDDWFDLNHWSGNAGLTHMEMYVTENSSGGNRVAVFTVAAGTIRFKVKVTQTEEAMVRIKVTVLESENYPDNISDYGFISTPGMERNFHLLVEWYPESYDCDVQMVTFGTPVEFISGYGIEATTLQGGRKLYEIKLAPFEEGDFDIQQRTYKNLSTYVQFAVGNQFKLIRLWHRATDVRFETNVYRLDVPERLNIFLNVNQEVVSVDDPYDILSAETKQMLLGLNTGWSSGYINNNVGSLTRDVIMGDPAPEKDGKKAYITFRVKDFPQYRIPDIVLEIEAYYLFPNSYLLKPGESVHIPVRKAYRAWSQYPMFSALPQGEMGCEVVWQDAGGLVSEIALTPVYSGYSIDSEIFVRTDGAAGDGNAVVALTIDGDIVWSWHLWVTNEDPTTPSFTYLNKKGTHYTTFMNRNFGALSHGNSSDLVKRRSQGLFYQYGRKDPFPPANDINDSTRRLFADHHIPIEYPSGRQQFRSAARQNWANELQASIYSIQNPTTHIYTTSVPHQWSIEGEYNWDFFSIRGTYHKTEFDPCPDGWELPLHYPAWGDAEIFFIPLPLASGNEFGYTKGDGYYMPASGFIDNEGYYIYTGYYAGSWNVAALVWDILRPVRFQVHYEPPFLPPDNTYFQYIEGFFSEAHNIRCTRAVESGLP